MADLSESNVERDAVRPTDTFRDRVASIDKDTGKRIWIYPRKPRGTFHRARVVMAILLMAFMVGVPFIKVDGHPLFLFNVVERKFIVLGFAFWPQDFHLFALAFLSLIVFIVLFTAVYGRVWCGWACPQTIFMELVFRKIEYWIEGDAGSQRALDARPANADKIFRKVFKHAVFFGLSFVVGNILLAWIIGVDDLWLIVTDPPGDHFVGLAFMIAFSLLFYGIFARFRENACIYVCPYGRLQSVLLDKNSIVVMYDFKRGEPRGPLKRSNGGESRGDCVDCTWCVQVCPTGIDIRNGTQLECINCTACIDACNSVMDRIRKPRKLIRYASHHLISSGARFSVTPRLGMYSLVLVLLLVVVSGLLLTRKDIEATVLRAKGSLYQVTAAGNVANLYTASIVNKTFDELPLDLKLEGVPGQILLAGADHLVLRPDELIESTFIIEIPPSAVTASHMTIRIGLYSGDRRLDEVATSFVAPTAGLKK